MKSDSIEFCSVQKGRENVRTYILYVRTVDACVVMCGEDGTYQEFTGREQDFVNKK
jgi:hypothetical protein